MNALMAQGDNTTTQDAADSLKYYPVWQQEYAEGTTDLQFRDWLKQYMGGQQSMMPMNAFRYG